MSTCEDCYTIPPVIAVGYQAKGSWEKMAGMPVYITGPPTPKTIICVFYDVFGPSSQILQGADSLAAALEPFGTAVVIPDLFHEDRADAAWWGPDAGEAGKAKVKAYMANAWEMEQWVKMATDVLAEGKKKWEGVEAWASLGICWGGKVTVVLSGKDSPWKVSGQVHPGGFAKEDADKITIPHIVLASNGEDPGIAQYYKDVLENGKNGVVETYSTMHHGWMGTRANLSNEDNLKEYTRGYNQIASFFGEHLKA